MSDENLGSGVIGAVQKEKAELENRELTFGEKAVGLTFNPSNNPKVDEIKALYAKIIDFLHGEKTNRLITPYDDVISYDIAIRHAIDAQMNAVKVITFIP